MKERKCRMQLPFVSLSIAVCLGLFSGLVSVSATAGDLYIIKEADEDGGSNTLPARGGISDINSTLDITLDKPEIRLKIVESFDNTGFDPKQVESITRLQEWAAAGIDALPGVLAALESWNRDPENINAFESNINDAANALIQILEYAYENDPILREKIINRIDEYDGSIPIFEQYRIVFDATAEYANALDDSLNTAIGDQAISIMFAAWLRTKELNTPLHLAGFDSYPVGDYYRVPRWNVALSEQQLQEFEQLKNAASNANKMKTNLFDEAARAAIRAAFEKFKELAQACGQDLISNIKPIVDDSTGFAADLIRELNRLRSDIESLIRIVTDIYARYSVSETWTNPDLLFSSLHRDYAAIEDAVNRIGRDAESLTGESGGLASAVDAIDNTKKELVKATTNSVNSCTGRFSDEIGRVVNPLKDAISVAISSGEINQQALELGDEVTRHDLSSLPEQTSLNLHFTGKREEGDVIQFRLAAAKTDPESETSNTEPTVLQDARISLYRIQPYLGTTVCLIYADPIQPTALNARFNYAASYSLLLKWGYRNSSLYNRLFRVGIGLNVAALDFDGNDTPEAGFGIVLSWLKDFVQGGYGCNLGSNGTTYFFVGVRLPMPNIPFPGGSSDDS